MQHHRLNAERLDPRRRPRAYAHTPARVSHTLSLSLGQLRYGVQQLLARLIAR